MKKSSTHKKNNSLAPAPTKTRLSFIVIALKSIHQNYIMYAQSCKEGMYMFNVIGIVASISLTVLLIFRDMQKEENNNGQKLDYNKLCSNIDNLQILNLQLENIENIIINLECYNDTDLTKITLSDSRYSCDILCNSNSAVLNDLYAQREVIRNNITSLLSDISK